MPVRTAVVGVGHLGKAHARLLEAMPEVELVGVVDSRESIARAVGEEWGVPHSTSAEAALESWRAEAVSIVVPTAAHAELAQMFLSRGVDVFVEKPLARTPAEGQELCRVAEENGRILQVGHVERFNPVVKAVAELEIRPRYVEGDRLAPFSFRSTDIGVILDLMIHDIDLCLALIGSPVADIEAFGGAIFTPREDLASARMRFENGAIARLTANRVALKPARRMRLFSRDSYVSLDFEKKYGLIIKKAPGWDLQKLNLGEIDTENIDDLWKFVFEGLLTVKELRMDEGNPLREELGDFIASVASRESPLVDGRAGLRALEVAYRVRQAIEGSGW